MRVPRLMRGNQSQFGCQKTLKFLSEKVTLCDYENQW